MRSNILAAATAALAIAVTSTTAFATCTRLGFSVNDYGKDGPTNDAKKLLDTYIAKWSADHGLKKYTTGKKDVSCELFLDFGVFDEHTCKASASVCWAGPAPLADAAAKASKTQNASLDKTKDKPKPQAKPAAKPQT